MKEQRYRLRLGDKIAGYLRRIHGTDFYSPDGFWWTGRSLKYTQVDESVEMRDRNRTRLYEWDIVRFKPNADKDEELGVFLWNKQQERWILRSIDTEIDYHLNVNGIDLFNGSDLLLESHVFLNPDLQRAWGLQE
jgi:hypothetical protein